MAYYGNGKRKTKGHNCYKGANYIWRVEWRNYSGVYGVDKYRAFTNKQQALIFMTKLQSNDDNSLIELKKYFG